VTVPVALFAYTRADTLARTLASLRENGVPLIYAFSDGPKTPAQASAVAAVRDLLRGIEWAEVRRVERPENLGLGRSIRAGVAAVLTEHERVIVFEDDLVAAPGTYRYLCAALDHYAGDENVLSITGYTHPRVVPRGVRAPYFDGRTECYVWATWRRGWVGMEKDALTLMQEAEGRGVARDGYGIDLVHMARDELRRNIWAVRWTYLHLARGGLCLRPPWNLVHHIGVGGPATNAGSDYYWSIPIAGVPPEDPIAWPAPVEHPECPRLWRKAAGPMGMRVAMATNLLGSFLHRLSTRRSARS
jgi:hypothetical protein